MFASLTMSSLAGSNARQFEYLDRGVVAVRQNNQSALVSWRSLASDDPNLGFNVYRTSQGNTVKLNTEVLSNGTNFIDNTANFTQENTYFVKKVLNNVELDTKGSYTMPANKGIGAYITVPIKAGSKPHFVWVGDFDSDGAYDFLLDRPLDNHQLLEAYSSKGDYLWTVDMGVNSENKNNITPGASTIDVGMWDGATVYDIDSDGRAEVMIRVADGTILGNGQTFSLSGGNAQAIVILDGQTGALKYSIGIQNKYIDRGPLACMMQIGYLDGTTPSLICWLKNRNADKSFNSMMVAYKVVNGKLQQEWLHDNWTDGGGAEAHQFRVADVDYDGKDEILHMGYALNSDGSLRYTMPDIVHGDRYFVGAYNKTDNVMMGFGIQQSNPNGLNDYYYNASTGKIIWRNAVAPGNAGDVARGNVGDFDPNSEGFEVVSLGSNQMRSASTGNALDGSRLYPVQRLWWDGDLLSESYNDGKIEKFNYNSRAVDRVATTWKIYGSSGSERGVGMFHGDIIGDWREESILVNETTNELVIFTTDIPSDYKIYTLAQNPCYRNGMTAKGYVQSNMLDYFLGANMNAPQMPNIEIIGGDREPSFNDSQADPAFIKNGKGSQRQTIQLGDPIESFSYYMESIADGSVSVTGLPKGIDCDINYQDHRISFSGIPTSEPGYYEYVVSGVGVNGSEINKGGAFTIIKDTVGGDGSVVKENVLQTTSVYPIPMTDYCTVVLGDDFNNTLKQSIEWYLTTLTGMIIQTGNIVNDSYFTISRNGLDSGIYFLNIVSDNTHKIFRIIIK